MSQSASIRELAARIARLERDLRNVSVSPQLGRSSLDDDSLNVYDADGGQVAVVGRQHDGTYTAASLDGPVPPVPAGLVAKGGPGECAVSWDGTYEDDARASMDFHVVEVWVADSDFSDRSEARLLGHFANESGGELSAILPKGQWYVALVSKAQSGRRSAVSERVVVEVESVLDQSVLNDLETALEGLGDDLGDLTGMVIPGLRADVTDLTDVQLPALGTAIAGAQGDIADAFGQIGDVDARASQAITDAGLAGDAAAAAQSTADTARAEATSKAEAAQSAAQAHADAQAEAARLAAIAAASGDAEDKANAAKAAAIATAALDASDKAGAAQAAAEMKAAAAQAAGEAAQAKADKAETDAAEAAVAAGKAQADATAAGTSADAAQAAASDAQSVAQAANNEALAAAGLAASKGEVIYQASPPTGTRANAANLWIRTSDNKPHTYNGTTWVAVTDKAATDAAAAAGTAQSSASAAASAAATAQSKANAAHTLAGTAESNAQTAITSANAARTAADNVAKSLFSPSNPSGTAPYGSIWFKVNPSGEVIGQWQQTAAGIASTWTSRPVRSEVISNLDVGKLTAGTANIATVTAQKIAGAVATFLELNADQINAGTISTERLNAAAVAAAVGAFVKVKADQITAVGAGFDTAVVNSLFADMFAANKITAQNIDTGTLASDAGFIGVLNSATIIGALIKTAATGLRTQIDTEGLRTFNAANVETTRLSSADGGMKLDGSLTLGEDSRISVGDPALNAISLWTVPQPDTGTGDWFARGIVEFTSENIHVGEVYGDPFGLHLNSSQGARIIGPDGGLRATKGRLDLNTNTTDGFVHVTGAWLRLHAKEIIIGEPHWLPEGVKINIGDLRAAVTIRGDQTVIKGVVTPTADTDAVNKKYVDDKMHEDDTDWVNVPYASGFTAGTPGQLRARRIGNVVYLDGGATGHMPRGAYTHVGKLPTEITPPSTTQYIPASGTSGRSGGAQVTSDGSVRFVHYWDLLPSWMSASGTSFVLG